MCFCHVVFGSFSCNSLVALFKSFPDIISGAMSCSVPRCKSMHVCDISECVVSQGTSRGNFGWESSLRQKPQARTVFQAGTSNWSQPINPDKDSKKGAESQDEVVGILVYTARIPLIRDWPLCSLKRS